MAASIIVAAAGITPAYAGTMCPTSSANTTRRDHPRLRGDHVAPGTDTAWREGSPPPTRGPSCSSRKQTATRWDHPRLRGDHAIVTVPAVKSKGITPAYAGTITLVSRVTTNRWDHPRLRGDHLNLPSIDLGVWGSPPPTRGPYLSTRGNRNLLATNGQVQTVKVCKRNSRNLVESYRKPGIIGCRYHHDYLSTTRDGTESFPQEVCYASGGLSNIEVRLNLLQVATDVAAQMIRHGRGTDDYKHVMPPSPDASTVSLPSWA